MYKSLEVLAETSRPRWPLTHVPYDVPTVIDSANPPRDFILTSHKLVLRDAALKTVRVGGLMEPFHSGETRYRLS